MTGDKEEMRLRAHRAIDLLFDGVGAEDDKDMWANQVLNDLADFIYYARPVLNHEYGRILQGRYRSVFDIFGYDEKYHADRYSMQEVQSWERLGQKMSQSPAGRLSRIERGKRLQFMAEIVRRLAGDYTTYLPLKELGDELTSQRYRRRGPLTKDYRGPSGGREGIERKLRALEIVEFIAASENISKQKAKDNVAEALCSSVDAIEKWPAIVRNYVGGDLELRLAKARHEGSEARPEFQNSTPLSRGVKISSQLYGRPALKMLANNIDVDEINKSIR